MEISFTRPSLGTNAIRYIQEVLESEHLSSGGKFNLKCTEWMQKKLNANKILLTQSCTASLEIAAILLDLKEGDEIIMPSFTFVSTANAFVMRGAKIVFVDIRRDTLNIDESLIENAISSKTKAIVVVHYAGISCEMDVITKIAKSHSLFIIEDAAQCIMSSYKNKYLGTIGELGTISFHPTKNLTSGKGGALLINNDNFYNRSKIICEKGTNRSMFLDGKVDKYTWKDIGSSYAMSNIAAALLWSQFENAKQIIESRLEIWNLYHSSLIFLERMGKLQRPYIPENCIHNGHLYYIILPNGINRNDVISDMNEFGIQTNFHYIPLDQSDAGRKFGRVNGKMDVTHDLPYRLIRLPLWAGLSKIDALRVVKTLEEILK